MKNFIYYLMLPLMLLAFAACGEKNSDPGENPDKLVPDPEGTIEVSARYDAWTGVAGIRIDDAYNFPALAELILFRWVKCGDWETLRQFQQ